MDPSLVPRPFLDFFVGGSGHETIWTPLPGALAPYYSGPMNANMAFLAYIATCKVLVLYSQNSPELIQSEGVRI